MIDLKEKIRNIPDFPQEGILFRDITTLLADPAAFRQVIDALTDAFRHRQIDAVVAIESRGYILGAPLACNLGAALVPVRKPGKLPWQTYREEYSLEYGTNALEIHRDAIAKGAKVLVVDDLIATGGSARAAVRLVEKCGGTVMGLAFMIELTDLKGRDLLNGYEVMSLVSY